MNTKSLAKQILSKFESTNGSTKSKSKSEGSLKGTYNVENYATPDEVANVVTMKEVTTPIKGSMLLVPLTYKGDSHIEDSDGNNGKSISINGDPHFLGTPEQFLIAFRTIAGKIDIVNEKLPARLVTDIEDKRMKTR